MNVSTIICTKDRHNDLIECIESLKGQTYPTKEIIIIDSGQKMEIFPKIKYICKDPTKELIIDSREKILENKFIKIKYIKYNSGLTSARNMGITKSEGDIILFLDDDVILDSNYVHNIVRIFEHYKNVGCACGDIINDISRSKRFPDLIEYTPIKKIRNFIFNVLFLTSWNDGKFHPSGFPTFPIGKKDIMYIHCLTGANMAFRREILDKYKFDENLQGYCYMEDCDMSYRVSREYNIIYTPYAKLIHNVSPTSRYSDYTRMKMVIQNHYYLFNKNFPRNSYNKFAFWTSIFGLFFICFLGKRKEGIKGLYDGLKLIDKKKLVKGV